MKPPPKWVLRNASGRPLELHLPTGVVILPPRGTLEVDSIDPLCAALERRGLLTRHQPRAPQEGVGQSTEPAMRQAGDRYRKESEPETESGRKATARKGASRARKRKPSR